MEEFFRQNLGLLTTSEVVVAVAFFVAPGASEDELKRLSGVIDRFTFRRCLRHLKELGLSIKSTAPVDQVYTPVDQTYSNLSKESTPLSIESTPPVDTVYTPVEEVYSMDFEKALLLADEMDADGDERNPHSNFQFRRKQQIPLLQQAWADLFKQELNPLAAKELLQKAHSQAIDVYYAMQKAAERNIERPLGYVKKILENTKPKEQQAPSEDLLPVTEEMRKKWAVNQQLLRVYGWEEA